MTGADAVPCPVPASGPAAVCGCDEASPDCPDDTIPTAEQEEFSA